MSEAERLIEEVIRDTEQPVVVFALEWCEFCHSLRKMLQELGITFCSVDLDSDAYREGGLGRQIRLALTEKTGVATIPQVFVGGEFVGGCTDVVAAYQYGELQALLDACGADYKKGFDLDFTKFLPGWLHPR